MFEFILITLIINSNVFKSESLTQGNDFKISYIMLLNTLPKLLLLFCVLGDLVVDVEFRKI